MRALLPALLAFLVAAPAAAQLTPLAEGGTRALGLGGASVALADDVWGLGNPAAWATLEQGGAGLFASQAFGMPELRLAAAALAHPTRHGTLAASARTYGFEDFRESVFGLGAGRAVPLSPTRRLHLGLAARYTTVEIPGFGSAGALGLSAGLLTEVMPGLAFGAHALNLNRPALSSLDPLQARLDVGLAYHPTPVSLLVLAAGKDVDHPLSVRGGLETQPVEVLRLRAGFATAPTRFSAGLGVLLDRLRADVAFDRHEVLGWTPAFEMGVRW